jgi:hypothetical protein
MSFTRKAAWTAVAIIVVAGATNRDDQPQAQAVDGTEQGIPTTIKDLYEAAASTCPNLDWALLAGIGSVESDHGRSPLDGVSSGQNEAGAMGPMQFIGPTWNGVRRQHPEIGGNVYDPAHAIPAAAHLLCDTGVREGDVDGAVWMYNHDPAYVEDVKKRADAYRTGGQP